MLALFQIVALCAAADAAPRFPAQGQGLMTPEQVIHIRTDGPECVFDVVGKLPKAGLERMDMWIVRRTEGGKIQILTIDWTAISERGSAATNYQLFDGDRLCLQTRPTK